MRVQSVMCDSVEEIARPMSRSVCRLRKTLSFVYLTSFVLWKD